ncbi:hypothetical protein [Streptomyces sp. FIT100]|uniref:hypothetical protein n=1 Tax=Streptomyces sp. FIT100 TaxID=2837956 RepID=UPI0021CA09FF|nr:hypothetical protein [Streptomyces sp. FIT100]UUN29445.1 hypothetical protein KK483_26005 [Streptomyces sp. FIT100]
MTVTTLPTALTDPRAIAPSAPARTPDVVYVLAPEGAPTDAPRVFTAINAVMRTVKPWKLAEFVAEMEAAGAPKVADKTTGEVHDVPGIVIKPTRARTHALTWRKGGKDATAEAWRTGALAHQLAAITTGGEQ